MSELRGSSEADVIIDRLLLNCTRWRHHRTRHTARMAHRGLSERERGWNEGRGRVRARGGRTRVGGSKGGRVSARNGGRELNGGGFPAGGSPPGEGWRQGWKDRENKGDKMRKKERGEGGGAREAAANRLTITHSRNSI